MPDNIVYHLDGSTSMILFIICLYGGAEFGFRAGRRAKPSFPETSEPHVATIEAALLGLLALLLGFAFSMAMTRFDVRKQLIVDESNDLETTYLRAKLLPEPSRSHCGRLLREYVDSRVDYYQAGDDAKKLADSLERTRELQVKLWCEAVAAVKENSDGVSRGFFVETLNGLIDDHTKRVAAMDDLIPQPILWLLALVACMTIGVTGYSSGLRSHRLVGLRLVLAMLVAATLVVIIDLDRPRDGLIRITNEAMVDLTHHLDAFDQ